MTRAIEQGFTLPHDVDDEPGEDTVEQQPGAVDDDATAAEPKPKRSRENSKQAQVIELLRRPEGATI